jgi:hypothetical protein
MTIDPLSRRLLADAQRGADFAQRLLFKKPQQHRVTIRGTQPFDGIVQGRAHPSPGLVG